MNMKNERSVWRKTPLLIKKPLLENLSSPTLYKLIMIQLTREEALQRLDNPINLKNIIHKSDWSRQSNGGSHGRGGTFTKEEKSLITSLSEEIGNKETASLVGCNPASIPYWKKGQNSHRVDTNAESTRQNQSVMEENQNKISEKAIDKVLQSLDLIQDDKLRACNAVELATIVQKLSGVNTGKNGGSKTNINVVVYTPQQKGEDQFETVTVRSE